MIEDTKYELRITNCISCLVVIGLWFSNCQRKEQPVPKFDRGNATTVQIALTSNYKNQVWYNLAENKLVGTNLKTDWDIAFEASAEGWHIILNSSKAMRASQINVSDLASIKDTTGSTAQAKPDMPSGNLDSTAIGDWRNKEVCYIINRGYNENARFQGFWKLKIKSVNASSFSFEYGEVYGKTVFEGWVNKNSLYRFNAFSFTTKQQVQIEPPRNAYDLCFTQFTTVFYDPFQYYQVTGVLTSSGVQVLKIPNKVFSEITITDTTLGTFSPKADVIGHDWKSYNQETSVYTTYDKIGYIIKDPLGFYYKLHFIDFYNDKGEKGYPVFEFARL